MTEVCNSGLSQQNSQEELETFSLRVSETINGFIQLEYLTMEIKSLHTFIKHDHQCESEKNKT